MRPEAVSSKRSCSVSGDLPRVVRKVSRPDDLEGRVVLRALLLLECSAECSSWSSVCSSRRPRLARDGTAAGVIARSQSLNVRPGPHSCIALRLLIARLVSCLRPLFLWLIGSFACHSLKRLLRRCWTCLQSCMSDSDRPETRHRSNNCPARARYRCRRGYLMPYSLAGSLAFPRTVAKDICETRTPWQSVLALRPLVHDTRPTNMPTPPIWQKSSSYLTLVPAWVPRHRDSNHHCRPSARCAQESTPGALALP